MSLDWGLRTTENQQVVLEGVAVRGELLGGFATVTVEQRYVNRHLGQVEAIYTFPLPSDAKVTGFEMISGDKRLKAECMEREAAFQTYDDALVAGHGAALVEQERHNVFTASVGNILPGEQVVIQVEYIQRLRALDGELRWVIPTLVAPRYIPGTPQGNRTGYGTADPTDQVPDADRISPEYKQVPYRVSLDLAMQGASALTVTSPSHAIISTSGEGGTRVRFARDEEPLDRDIVLSIGGLPDEGLVTLMTHRKEGKTGTVALTIVPDLLDARQSEEPQTVVLLVDTSGSMSGGALAQAKIALRLCLRHLRQQDRFNIIEFNSGHQSLFPAPRALSQAALSQADQWVEQLRARGGTEMLQPLLDAVAMSQGGVVVLLTDGEVGNELEILQQVMAVRGATRLYTFGIGTNVSDMLLRQLARESSGGVEFIYPGERIEPKVVTQFARALAARVTGLSVRWSGVEVNELAGELPTALVDSEPLVLLARYEQPGSGSVELRGQLGAKTFVLQVPVVLPAVSEMPVVERLWAGERIRQLETREVVGRRAASMRERIVQLSIQHQVLSSHTAMVVVETRTGARRQEGAVKTIAVPVSVPHDASRLVGGVVRAAAPKPSHSMPMSRVADAGPTMAAPMADAGASSPASEADYFGAFVSKAKKLFTGGPKSPAPSVAAPPPPPPAAAPAYDLGTMAIPAASPRSRGVSGAPQEKSEILKKAMAPGGAMREEEGGSRSDTGNLESLLLAQDASGFWLDGSGDAGGKGSLVATARALLRLLQLETRGDHPQYGGPICKAIDAVLARVDTLKTLEAGFQEVILATLLAAAGRPRLAQRVRQVALQLGQDRLLAAVVARSDARAWADMLQQLASR